jgi:hypothetical protein
MENIITQNYKAEMLLTAVRGLGAQKGLGYKNLLSLSRLTTKLEGLMKPYLEMRRDIISKHSAPDPKTGQHIVAPEKQDEAMKEMEEIAQAEVTLDVQVPLVLTVKDDSFLDFNTVSAFTNVLGETNFVIEMPEVAKTQAI